MKKLLLLGAFVLGSFFTATAQNGQSCATAIALTGSGTTNVPAFNTVFYLNFPSGGNICTFADGNAATPRAIWYKYTATASGILTIDAAIPANNPETADTRVRILGGTCGAFTCIAQNDDVDGPNDDYRSKVTFTAIAGNTYYIVWDNKWTATAFSFTSTFTPQNCFVPTDLGIATGSLTSTSITLEWSAPAVGTPNSYQVEYGPSGFVQGQGTIVNTNTTSAQLSPLTPGTIYSFYIRTNCGFDNSVWDGPYTFTTLLAPATLPYTQAFDNAANRLEGWTLGAAGAWNTGAGTANVPPHSGTGFAFSNTATTAVDKWLFSREISLEANVPVNISFYTWYLGDTFDISTLKLSVGTTNTVAAQTTPLGSFDMNGGAPAPGFVQRTATFTPTTSGNYIFGFRHNSAPASGAWSLLLDTVSFTAGTPSGVDEALASKFAVFPNPATNLITVSGAEALVNSVEIIDLNGRTVKTVKGNGNETQINISDLSAGVYMMNIASDKGVATKKIVKQ